MHYIGCKKRLLAFIHYVMKQQAIKAGVFCDLFAGTATVGCYFKQQGFQVISNDWLYCSYALQQVKIAMNRMPRFEKLTRALNLYVPHPAYGAHSIIRYLNQLPGQAGFVYRHYSPSGTANQPKQRLYYTDENSKKIDAIREQIEVWKVEQLIDEAEYYLLVAALLKAVPEIENTAGIQTGFLKQFRSRALQVLMMKLPEVIYDNQPHQVHHQDSLTLIDQLGAVDVLYVDPPYSRIQYFRTYHLLETIARWDYPSISGICGVRQDRLCQSSFCYADKALSSLEKIVASRCYQHLLLSYSDDGLMHHDTIMTLLQAYGDVTVYCRYLPRYICMPKINADPAKSHVKERIYYLKPHG